GRAGGLGDDRGGLPGARHDVHDADDRGVPERDRAGPARRASSRPPAGGTQHPRGGWDGMSALGLLGAALLVGIHGGLVAVVRWGISRLGLRLVAAEG